MPRGVRNSGKPSSKGVETMDKGAEMAEETKESTGSAPSEPKYLTDLHRIWKSGKAYKIVIAKDETGALTAGPFKLGTLPEMTYVRGIPVIVPAEILSILNDTIVDVPMQSWDDMGRPGKIFHVKETRFPYQVVGEVPWREFEEFTIDQRKRVLE